MNFDGYVPPQKKELRAKLFMDVMESLLPVLAETLESFEAARESYTDLQVSAAMIHRQLKRLEVIEESSTPWEAMTDAAKFTVLSKRSYVYFVEAGDYIKIGYSKNPLVRLGQIRAGVQVVKPEDLDTSNARLLAIEEGDLSTEKQLHRRFKEFREVGEWFRKNDRITHYIQSITTPA